MKNPIIEVGEIRPFSGNAKRLKQQYSHKAWESLIEETLDIILHYAWNIVAPTSLLVISWKFDGKYIKASSKSLIS